MTESKIFDPAKREKLNNPLRLEWVPPARVADHLDMEAGGEYIDLGAGTGYLSRHIGESGNTPTVHAVDIEPLMVEEMQATLGDFSWLKPVLMKPDELPNANMSIDGLWCIAVFHELKAPEPLLAEIYRVLKPGGKLLVVDWLKKQEACQQGPPLEHRIAESEVIANLQHAGFTDASAVKGFEYHFGILATKL